jgi:hypothetical protein
LADAVATHPPLSMGTTVAPTVQITHFGLKTLIAEVSNLKVIGGQGKRLGCSSSDEGRDNSEHP